MKNFFLFLFSFTFIDGYSNSTTPILNCECETPYLDNQSDVLNPACTFYCYEILDLELLEEAGGNNELLPDVDNIFPDDSCCEFVGLEINFEIIDGSCGEKIVTRTLRYSYTNTDGILETIECVQQFSFLALSDDNIGETINGTWTNALDEGRYGYYTPEEFVEVPCGTNTSPEGLVAYFDLDTPGRPEGKENDDFTNTPNIIEFNEGYTYGYPYVVIQGWTGNFHALPIDNTICNVYAVNMDIDEGFQECNGNKKIERYWTIINWCTTVIYEFTQIITTVDTVAPIISNPDLTISTDLFSCERAFVIPAPELLDDNCDNAISWNAEAPIETPIINGVIKLPKGTTPITYYASDCFGNESSFTMQVTVEDGNPEFNLTNLYCIDSIPQLLPLISENRYSGTWSPPVIDTGVLGESIYTFTPNSDCANSFTINISVQDCDCPNPAIFNIDAAASVCEYETISIKVNVVDSVINGQWATNGDGVFSDQSSLLSEYSVGINDISSGAVTLTFTTEDPDGKGPCQSTSESISIEVQQLAEPYFSPLDPYCEGDFIDPLPLVSENGITGFWSPAIDNTISWAYTFTPDIDQCAYETEFVIEIIPIDLCVSSLDDNIDAQIELFPNPASDMLYLKNVGESSIYIFNLDGIMVLHSKKLSKIDISTLKNGTYILQIYSQYDNISNLQKLVVAR